MNGEEAMKVNEITKILNAAIPYKDSWITESYGAFNIEDSNKDVKKILYCVTATNEVVEYFHKNKYDLLISHHPFLVDVPILIYHTALDCCKGGLNDMWANFLEVKQAKHFSRNLGWVGKIDPISFDDLTTKIEKWIGYNIKGIKHSNGELITSVVICTGLGGMVYHEAANTKADCYITGELTSLSTNGFKAVIETGHTNSEFIGVYLFRKLLPQVQIDLAPSEIDYFGKEVVNY